MRSAAPLGAGSDESATLHLSSSDSTHFSAGSSKAAAAPAVAAGSCSGFHAAAGGGDVKVVHLLGELWTHQPQHYQAWLNHTPAAAATTGPRHTSFTGVPDPSKSVLIHH
jgi:hypothetical protein